MKPKAGVYMIRNLANGKQYIGSAVDILHRWRTHRYELNHHKHCNHKLQSSWNKYSPENFVFEVLLYCDPAHCILYEQIAMDWYKPWYNICKSASQSFLGRKHAAKTKQRLSLAKIGKRNPNYGKYGKDHNRYGTTHTQQALLKMSIAHKGAMVGEANPRALLSKEQISQIKTLIADGISNVEIARLFHVCPATISHIKCKRNWKKS